MKIVIDTIQLKRGTKENLITYLVGDNKLKQGEPALETDTFSLKFGDGQSDYNDLDYFVTGLNNIEIKDSLAGEIIAFDSDLGKWVNKPLLANNSLEYQNGVSLKNFAVAEDGQMPIKDTIDGLKWVNPVTDTQLNTAVTEANQAKLQAGNYASSAANSAMRADQAEGNAQRINDKTIELINNKFWWGSLEEYNALTEIREGTFYFIKY